MSYMDLTGRRFGRLMVLADIGRSKGKNRAVVWRCLCDCGTGSDVKASNLRSGHTQSCGCLTKERASKNFTTHGLTPKGRHHTLYRTWSCIKYRCLNPNAIQYRHYGGRGIRVCAGFRDSFPAFLAAMGERPPGKTVDRRDNEGHYSCGQCDECSGNGWPFNLRWATWVEQRQNSRRRSSP